MAKWMDFVDVPVKLSFKDGSNLLHNTVVYIDEGTSSEDITGIYTVIPEVIEDLSIESFFCDISVIEVKIEPSTTDLE